MRGSENILTQEDVEHLLAQVGVRHFRREHTGGADWSANWVWNLGDGIFLATTDYDDFALLQRNDDEDTVEEITTGSLQKVVGRIPSYVQVGSLSGYGEGDGLRYSDDPDAYNAKLAKLMNGLKRDVGATAVRQNYKGTGSKSHRRQLYVSIPYSDRGGPDVWLDNGFVQIGGVVGISRSIPNRREYGDDPPEAVYAWVRDTFTMIAVDWDRKHEMAPPMSRYR